MIKQTQAMVVGLGQFGMSLSRALSNAGVEVIAIDRRESKVQQASEFAAQAICIDATVEDDLAALDPAKRDFAVCAIGDESREGAIVVTALLRQLGVEQVIARATDDLLERILTLVGATQVVNPEQAYGEDLAQRLVFEDIVGEIPLGDTLALSELKPRPIMVGKTPRELDLEEQFGLIVLAVLCRKNDKEVLIRPDEDRKIEQDDTVIVAGGPGATQALHEEW